MALILTNSRSGLPRTHRILLHLLLIVDEQLEDIWIPAGIEGGHVHDVADVEVDWRAGFENQPYDILISIIYCEVDGCISITIHKVRICAPFNQQLN